MDLDEIKKTDIWELYEKGTNYLRRMNVYSDTDRNYRMYNGNQWEGAKLDGIEAAQYNFIETIVNYKVSTINQNYYAVHFSSENFEQREFRKTAERVCELLDKKASKIWEKDQLDQKIRTFSKDAAINDEGIIYCYYDDETQSPVNEVLSKNNIQYGNEQSADIQKQPYILISQRKPINEIQEIAKNMGISREEATLIRGDLDTVEEAGDDSKYEKDEMCTIVTKLWKENGTVWSSTATKYVVLDEPEDTGMHYYPLTHFPWKEKKGWARGEGEVRALIPNQLELNKSLARMLLSIKQCAYAQRVANVDKISNPAALNQVGGLIKTKNGATVDDVDKIFKIIQPASMSTDVSKLMSDLISITRELKNASDIATGGINPEDASGKAILAVQQASQQPMTEQSTTLLKAIEDLAKIWLDMWVVYTPDGMRLEETETDPVTGEEYTQLVDVPSSVLENLKGTVKIDITPKSPYDKYAQELSLENLLKAGFFNANRVGELKIYAEALPDDSVMPKQKLLDICDKIEEEQEKIMQSRMEAQAMQQKVNQFLNGDAQTQASQINDYANEVQEEPPQEGTVEEEPEIVETDN